MDRAHNLSTGDFHLHRSFCSALPHSGAAASARTHARLTASAAPGRLTRDLTHFLFDPRILSSSRSLEIIMAFRLYNTMSSRVEEFQPLCDHDNEVRMYACGPTVYDYGHIGNFRTFVAVDLLYRFLRQSGYSVRYVMNITDVDDKIIRNAARDGVSVQQYTAKYQQAFLEDSAMIGIEQPHVVRATENIPQMA